MNLGIFCAGNLGKEIYDIAERINTIEKKWEDIFFVDNFSKKNLFYGRKVQKLSDCIDINNIEFSIATGEPATRKEIFEQLKAGGFKLTNLIDPTAIISTTAQFGEGLIIAPFSTISSDVIVGDNVLIQSYIRIGHDIKIGNHSVVSSNSAIGGKSIIEECVFIGLGAVVKENLHIGRNAILGMGSVLYKDVKSEEIFIGNPARITKGSEDKKVFR